MPCTFNKLVSLYLGIQSIPFNTLHQQFQLLPGRPATATAAVAAGKKRRKWLQWTVLIAFGDRTSIHGNGNIPVIIIACVVRMQFRCAANARRGRPFKAELIAISARRIALSVPGRSSAPSSIRTAVNSSIPFHFNLPNSNIFH